MPTTPLVASERVSWPCAVVRCDTVNRPVTLEIAAKRQQISGQFEFVVRPLVAEVPLTISC